MQTILEIGMDILLAITTLAMTLVLVVFTTQPTPLSKTELVVGTVFGVLLLVRCYFLFVA